MSALEYLYAVAVVALTPEPDADCAVHLYVFWETSPEMARVEGKLRAMRAYAADPAPREYTVVVSDPIMRGPRIAIGLDKP